MHDRRLHAGEAPPARAYVCLSLRSGVSALLCSRADRVIHRKSVISRHTQKKEGPRASVPFPLHRLDCTLLAGRSSLVQLQLAAAHALRTSPMPLPLPLDCHLFPSPSRLVREPVRAALGAGSAAYKVEGRVGSRVVY